MYFIVDRFTRIYKNATRFKEVNTLLRVHTELNITCTLKMVIYAVYEHGHISSIHTTILQPVPQVELSVRNVLFRYIQATLTRNEYSIVSSSNNFFF